MDLSGMFQALLGLLALLAGVKWVREKEFSFGNDADVEATVRIQGRAAVVLGVGAILCGLFLLLTSFGVVFFP